MSTKPERLSREAKRAMVLRTLARYAASEDARVTEDAVLDPSIRPDGPSTFVEPNDVLLTGVTGYLGSFLLSELLEQTNATVRCLVRAHDPAAALQRITAKLSAQRLFRPEHASRIVPIPADIGLPRLGLDADTYAALARSVDTIVHAAALVHFLLPYSAARAANVGGTSELLRLACGVRVKAFHYVSSISVFSQTGYAGATLTENDVPRRGDITTGYGQSKWVSEQLVFAARERGIPTAIYRPGFIGADTRTGVFNPDDFMSRLLVGSAQLGAAPELSMLYQVAPVDYVAGGIVALARSPSSLGKVFHLVHPAPPSWTDVVDMTNSAGLKLERVPYDVWTRRLFEAGNNSMHEVSPLVPSKLEPMRWEPGAREYTIFDAFTPGSGTVFGSSETVSALAAVGHTCPRWTEATMKKVLEIARAQGLLDCTGTAPAPQSTER